MATLPLAYEDAVVRSGLPEVVGVAEENVAPRFQSVSSAAWGVHALVYLDQPIGAGLPREIERPTSGPLNM